MCLMLETQQKANLQIFSHVLLLFAFCSCVQFYLTDVYVMSFTVCLLLLPAVSALHYNCKNDLNHPWPTFFVQSGLTCIYSFQLTR